MNTLEVRPNIPLRVALVDPEGSYDFELRIGTYQTTVGELLTLPRRAVEALNMLGPAPGEEIEILKTWSGRAHDTAQWSIRKAGEPMQRDERPESTPGPRREPIKAPTPIRRPSQGGPGLFDELGTGTYGPLPAAKAYAAPKPAVRRPLGPEPIPANVAFREITQFVSEALKANGMQWGDEAQKNIACTVMIAEYKAKRIGPWEREK